MADLGTVSILVDVRGQPLVRELATDLTNVAAAETKVSAATQRVMEDFRRTREIMTNVKRATDDTTASFQRFSARELQQASQRLNGFEKTLANTRRGMGEMGMGIQQVGYQVGDFLVQVQSGTNFFVAFGQQATQLVGILPNFSKQLGMSVSSLIGISTGLGIAIPLLTALGAYFMRAGEESKKASDSLKEYKNVLDSLNSSIDATNVKLLALGRGLAVDESFKGQVALESVNKAIKDLLSGKSISAEEDPWGWSERYRELLDMRSELEKSLKIIDAQSEAQGMLNGHLSEAKANLADETATRARHKAILDQINATENERKNIFHALAGEMEAVSAAGIVFSRLDLKSGVASAASVAETLAYNLGISLDTASKLAALGPQGIGGNDPSGKTYGGRGAAPTQGQIVEQRLAGAIGYFTPPKPGKTKRGGGGGSKTDPMEELRQQIKLQNELLGVSEAQERVLKALGDDRSKYSQKEIDAVTAEIEAYNQKKEAIERTKDIMETVSSSMEDAFMSMVDGTKSAKDAFKSMAAEILKELYRVLVVQRMVSAISGAFSFASGPSTGSFGLPFGGANASGGSMVTGKSYLVGENGPELVIPRHSGTVVNANQTSAMGGGSEGFTQNLSINVTGSDAAMVRTEVAKMIPQITNATKSAIIDAKQRGGQMAAAFR